MKKVKFWATSMGRREMREATYADNEYADMGRLKALIEKAEPGSPYRAALMLEMENLHTLRCEFPQAPAWQVDVVEIAQRKAEAAARAAAAEAPVEQAAAKPVATDPAPSLLDEAPSERVSFPTVDTPEGHVGPSPEATIEAAFLRFHEENPHVYDELVMLARRAKSRGASKVGIGMLFEVLRWRDTLRTGGDDFKLNNNYRSYYSREIMLKEEDLAGIFETRKLHEVSA